MRGLLLSFAVLVAAALSAQTTTIFTEDFESPSGADSVTTYTSGSTTGFTITSALAAGGTQSMHGIYGASDTTILTTDAFSTVGYTFILLKFDHIAKVEFFDAAVVEVSNDNGATWTQLTCAQYMGGGQFCGGGNKFTSITYIDWVPSSPSAIPDNTWWRFEEFDVSSFISNATQAKIRFKVYDANFSGIGGNYGWLIDNIVVDAAPCELIPPTASFVQPIFQSIAYTTGPFDIQANITDNSGTIDTAYVVYSLNGAPLDTVGMTVLPSGEYQGSIPAANIGDSICYYVVAVDGSPCQNTTVIPSNGTYCFAVAATPPAFCVGIPQSVFPYTEDFSTFTPATGASGASAFGTLNNNWTRTPGPGTSYGWCVRSASTSSTQTGPSGDNTGGGNYLFTESSMSGAPAVLTSKCLDFTNLTNPIMEFYFHMYGATMGTLEVEVSNGTTTSTLWTQNGQVQSSETDPWQKVTLPLSAFAGDIVQISWIGTRGSSFTSDMAIDDVYIFEPQPNDMGILSIDAPNNGGCDLTAAEPVIVSVVNLGTSPQTVIPVAFQLDNNSIVYDTLYANMQPGDTVQFTFNTTIDLSVGGQSYVLSAWTELPNEQTIVNDSVANYNILNTLSATPFSEDFQSFLPGQNTSGFWAQATGDNFDWSFGNGPTPSAGTGPSNDHTTGTVTGVYAYVETNGTLAGQIAQLESPCLDFSGLVAPKITFWYHMNGTTIGTLRVQGQDANGNWVTIWSETGDQGNQWLEATADLSSFAGLFSRVRFEAEMNGCCTGDIAIDDIDIYEPQPDDVGVTQILFPSGSGCGYSSADTIVVEVVNLGTALQGIIPLAYTVNGGAPVLDTIFGLLLPGDTIIYSIQTPANFGTTNQTYNVQVYTTLGTDLTNFNDTSSVSFMNEFTISTFPYSENFESTTYGNGTNANPGTLPLNWSVDPPTTTSTVSWIVGNGGTSSVATGPSGDHTPSMNGNGNYMYLEVSYGTNNTFSSLISPCVDFATLANPHVEFYYHRFGNNMGDLYVEVFDGNGWISVDTLTGTTQTTETDPFVRHVTPLTAFAGQAVRVRFRHQKIQCCAGDGAIDDVKFFEPVPLDLAVVSFLQPGSYSSQGTLNDVEVEIYNFGLDTVYTSPVSYSVNGGTPVTETWTGVLPPQSSTNFLFSTGFNAPGGQYNICSWTSLVGEQAPLNDTTCTTATGIQTITPYYFTDFESGAGSWIGQGGFNQWQYGTPAANTINSAYSGQFAWATNLTGNYQNNSDDNLYSPFFDMSSLLQCELSFYHWYNFEGTWDGGRIDFSSNGGTSWQTLGTGSSTVGTNWYNYTNLISSSQPGWSATSNQWIQSVHPLFFLNNNAGLVQFRFNMSTDGSVNGYNGWAIDDFELFAPIQLSGATSTITVNPTNNFILPATKTITAWIKNTGVIDLNTVDAVLEVDGGVLVTDPISFSTPLQIGDSLLHSFSVQWNATPGPHTICVYTSNPNGSAETYVPDDTTCISVQVFDAISTYPYCNDFESSLAPLVTLNAYSYENNSNWTEGLPQTGYLNDTYSGQNAWTTNLSGNYANRDSSALFSPLFAVNNVDCYRLSFYHKYKTEIYQDGGIVEYSNDGGASWQVLGGYQSGPNWYSTQYVTGLSNTTPGLPGWSGQSQGTNGWEYAEFDVLFPTVGDVIFRFRFGSDFSVTDEGWAIDDICFDEIGSCSPTQVEEYSGLDVFDVYPNPTTAYTAITFQTQESGSGQVELMNAIGQVIWSKQVDFTGLEQEEILDLSELSGGVYYVQLRAGNTTQQLKVIRMD